MNSTLKTRAEDVDPLSIVKTELCDLLPDPLQLSAVEESMAATGQLDTEDDSMDLKLEIEAM